MTSDPTPPSDPVPPSTPETPPHAAFAQASRAVFWSFFGVRKGRDMRDDAAKLKPQHVIVVGLFSALVFVLALVALVRFITHGL